MKTLILFVISFSFMCVAYSQTKPSDLSVSKTLKPISPLYPVAYDTAPLRKERVLSHSDSNQVSSISSQKMKLAPVGATNTKVEEGRPAPPPIIYYVPEKKTSEIKQDPPHF